MMISKRGRIESRPGAWDRGYDRRWQKASNEFLWRNPHCLGCSAIGVTRRATVVDHVIPHKGDQTLFWDPRNWQSCCVWHHSSIKLELERRYFRKEIHASDLKLSSEIAEKLSRERHKPATGLDGFAIAGS
jgi:5-methylcytosine-specific restriction endonuclease McrA